MDVTKPMGIFGNFCKHT